VRARRQLPNICHAPGANTKGSYDLGWEWLNNSIADCPADFAPSISCATVEYFRDGDPFTEAIRTLDHVASARAIIAFDLSMGASSGRVDNHYGDKSPIGRIVQAIGDAVSIPTGGLVGTRDPQQFLGSFDLKWSVVGRDNKGSPIVEFHLTNATTRASGTPAGQRLVRIPEAAPATVMMRLRVNIGFSRVSVGVSRLRPHRFHRHALAQCQPHRSGTAEEVGGPNGRPMEGYLACRPICYACIVWLPG
jgi:hypothetical protein